MADPSPPTVTGLFRQAAASDATPSPAPLSPLDMAVQLQLQRMAGRLENLEDKLDLLIDMYQDNLFAKVCGHAVEVLRNENGQLKYLTGLALAVVAIVYGVPVALDSQGIHLFAEAVQAVPSP